MLAFELIPESFFQNSDQVKDWLLWVMALGAIGVLVYGADRLVTSAAKLAKAMGMSAVIVGATVVSLGTTSPEALVSVTAAFQGKSGLALGNGVGSIICDTALIFGLCCCIQRLPKDRFLLNRHGWLQFAAGALLVGVLAVLAVLNGGLVGVMIPREVGIGFVVLLIAYLWISVRWARAHPIETEADHITVDPAHKQRAVLISLAVIVVGLAMVICGANVLVGSVGELCRRYHVPPNVLAVTLVAFGTSLPELVTGIMAIVRGHPELLIGNVIGADILNVLFVVGASASATSLEVPTEFYWLHVPVMMGALILFRLFISARGEHFKRWQGLPLLGLFVAYYAVLLWLVGAGVLTYEA